VKFSELVFSVTFAGSFSRSAVNYNAGAQTAVSNIIMATAVLVTLLFLMPLFYYTPNVILGAIIVTAVIGLIDYQAAYRLWKVDKLDFLACMCSFFGVLFISVPSGLGIAVSYHFLAISSSQLFCLACGIHVNKILKERQYVMIKLWP
jgi:MFS superfamily sulfate permease-like transporter